MGTSAHILCNITCNSFAVLLLIIIVMIITPAQSGDTCGRGIHVNISHLSQESQLDLSLIEGVTPLMGILHRIHASLTQQYNIGLQLDAIQHIQLDNNPDGCQQGNRSDDFKHGIHFQLISNNGSCNIPNTMECGKYFLTYNLLIDSLQSFNPFEFESLIITHFQLDRVKNPDGECPKDNSILEKGSFILHFLSISTSLP